MSTNIKNKLIEFFNSLPTDSIEFIQIKNEDEIEQSNDYFIKWEIYVSPKNKKACPIHICFSPEMYYGFHLCTFDELSKKIMSKTFVNPDIVIGGHEPIEISENEMLKRCNAVAKGQVGVEYRLLFNRITSAEVFMNSESFYPIKALGIGEKAYYDLPKW